MSKIEKKQLQQLNKKIYNFIQAVEIICDFVSLSYEQTKKTTKDYTCFDLMVHIWAEREKVEKEKERKEYDMTNRRKSLS